MMERMHQGNAGVWMIIGGVFTLLLAVCRQRLWGFVNVTQRGKVMLPVQSHGSINTNRCTTTLAQSTVLGVFGCAILGLKSFAVKGLGWCKFLGLFTGIYQTGIFQKPLPEAIWRFYAIGVRQPKGVSNFVSLYT